MTEREKFEEVFKKTEIYKREQAIRQKDILELSDNFGYFNIVANSAWEMWQAAKADAVSEGYVTLKIDDVLTIVGNASDALEGNEVSHIYEFDGEPSTWFDYHIQAEEYILLEIGKAKKAQEQRNG